MKNLQIFSELQKKFAFCDFDWRQSAQTETRQYDGKAGIFWTESGAVNVWECGFYKGFEIIEAYRLYGKEFPEHLASHNSSFVLYDSEKGFVLAARDSLGEFPLFFYENAETGNFVFSFSMNALLASKLFTPQINPLKIIEYIDFKYKEPPNNQTFYQKVYRIFPAHFLAIQKGGSESKRYAKLNLRQYKSFGDKEFIERFTQLFLKSVEKNIAPYKKVAATLSGGLDSSSVCCVAQSLKTEPLHTFNFDTETAEAQEDEYIEAVVRKWHNKHQTIRSKYSAYEAVSKIIKQNAQPHFVFNYTIQLDLIEAAKEAGCEVFLSGHFGDQVVTHGIQHLEELFAAKDWKNLKTALDSHFLNSFYIVKKSGENFPQNPIAEAKIHIFQKLTGKLRRENKWFEIPKMLWILNRYFDCGAADFWYFIKERLTRPPKISPPEIKQLLRPEFRAEAEQVKNNSHFEQLVLSETIDVPVSFTQEQHLQIFFASNQIYGQEEFHEIYRKNSLKAAKPFFDAELLELNLSIPLRLKFDGGIKRGTLRRAMKNYLPEQVAARTTKGEFTEYHARKNIALITDFMARNPDDHPVWQIIDKKVFDENVKILTGKKFTFSELKFNTIALVRTINLAIWLDHFQNPESEVNG